MTEKEIREAVEKLAHIATGDKNVKVLIDLAQSYLDIKGWPKEKKHAGRQNNSCFNKRIDGFNEALHLCRLVHLKECEKCLIE